MRWRVICLKAGPGSKPYAPAKLSYETLLACPVGGVGGPSKLSLESEGASRKV